VLFFSGAGPTRSTARGSDTTGDVETRCCVWCQNFVGLNFRAFAPKTQTRTSFHWLKAGVVGEAFIL
jgi:hypothetical protein